MPSVPAEQNATLGARDYPQWLTVERSLRQRLTRLLNAPTSADVALVKNTSEALSFVAFGPTGKAVIASSSAMKNFHPTVSSGRHCSHSAWRSFRSALRVPIRKATCWRPAGRGYD